MKSIIFGTTNPAKLNHIKVALEPLGIKVEGLEGIENLPEVVEDGQTPQENSRKKAVAYCHAVGQPVLAMDNALFIDGLANDEQPGMNTRRIPGMKTRPTDEEMVEYYSGLFAKMGGEATGHWEWALCLAFPDGRKKETTAVTPYRRFSSQPSPKRMPGYPMESLQIDPETNKFIVEMSEEEKDKFWQDSTGKALRELFKDF